MTKSSTESIGFIIPQILSDHEVNHPLNDAGERWERAKALSHHYPLQQRLSMVPTWSIKQFFLHFESKLGGPVALYNPSPKYPWFGVEH